MTSPRSTYHQIFFDQDLGPAVGRVVNDISVAIAAGEMTPEEGAAGCSGSLGSAVDSTHSPSGAPGGYRPGSSCSSI